MPLARELSIILLLTVANGLFAGAEIAMLSVRKTRLEELIGEGRRGARIAARLREDPERFFATVQVGITVVGASAAAFGGASVARDVAPLLERLGLGRDAAEEVALAVVIALVSYLSLVIGELVPKSLALRHAERYVLLSARPLSILAWIVRPVIWLLTTSSNLVLRIFGDTTTFTEARHSPEELQQLVEEAATAGALDREAGDIAARALDFGDLPVSAVMVPRSDVVSLSVKATLDEVRAYLASTPFRRVPIRGEGLDDVLGYATSTDLVKGVLAGSVDVASVARPPLLVTERSRAPDVLREMQRSRMQLAIVVDEQGTVTGIVTLEDLVEELIGEVMSEGEVPAEIVRREPDGSILVKGKASLRDVNRQLGLELPESEAFATIAGLVLDRARRIPEPGATFDVEGTRIEVVETSPRRILTVRLRRLSAP